MHGTYSEVKEHIDSIHKCEEFMIAKHKKYTNI